MWIIFAPGDRSRDTAHAQWPFHVTVMWSDRVTHNQGTDDRRMLKIGMCVGCVKLNSSDSQGQKVIGQGHTVMRHSSTKTSNISRKRHSVVEIHLSYRNRGRRSEWQDQIFDRKLLNSRFCACAVKICPKLAYCVVKSPQCYPLCRHSRSLNTTVFKPGINLILSGNCNKTANINVKNLTVYTKQF